MNDTFWINLLSPLTFFKLAWCIMALITLVECIRVWRPLYRIALIARAESKDEGLLVWVKVPAKIAGGLAAVALLNLLAGIVSLTFPPPTTQAALPDTWTQLMALSIPIAFIISAAVKMWMAASLRTGYKKVITTTAALPEKAAQLVESL